MKVTGRELLTRITARDFTARSVVPLDVALSVNSYTWDTLGGPKSASVHIEGPLISLWELVELLRCPVEIADAIDRVFWWGYVSAVEVRVGRNSFTVSLDTMSNKVAVAWTSSSFSGVMVDTTAFVENADSEATYGIKELISPMNDVDAAAALVRANSLLAEFRYPVPKRSVVPGSGAFSATIYCRGWWDTLGWRYYSNSVGSISYSPSGGAVAGQVFGDVAASTRVAQSFIPATAMTAHKVAVYLCKAAVPTGSPPTQTFPTDNVILDLCSDSAGAPGTVLATCTVAATAIATGFMWTEFALSVDVALSAATTYWLLLRRSGALSATAFYAVYVSQECGASGVCRLYNGSAYVAPSPDEDMLYDVISGKAVETQMADCVTSVGQFLTATDCDITTGVSTSEYRSEHTLAQVAMESICKNGDSSNIKLMATVGRERRVRIAKEPARGVSDYTWKVNTEGVDTLCDQYGATVLPPVCPVGMWVNVSNLIPGSVDTSRMADASAFFVRRATYIPASDAWIPDFLTIGADLLDYAIPYTYQEDQPGSWETLRQQVLRRDKFRCTTCGKTADETGGPLEIHHLLAREEGGRDGIENLVSLCHYHHTLTASYGVSSDE